MIWYIENYERSQSERETLEALAACVDWLAPLGWRIDNSLRLIWDADISTAGRLYRISLRYPNHFPHSPPLVLPRDEKERWSSHQYGDGGELCLEYGPDNWHPEVTGADMITSAHRLLGSETGNTEERAPAPSRHHTTLGQELRFTLGRFLVTQGLTEFSQSMEEGTVLSATVVMLFRKETYTHVMTSVELSDGTKWVDPGFPEPLGFEGYERPSAIGRWPANTPFPSTDTLAEFKQDCKAAGLEIQEAKKFVLVSGPEFKAYSLWDDGTVSELSVIPAQEKAARLDEQHAVLGERKVSLVGCGSLGSKVATMLARAGVGRFLLVDDDLMLPDNLVRHDLDWRDVGTHKAESVARRIQLVNPLAKCELRKHRLGGQESSGSIETLITSLSESDLIVDCTADSSVFNYLCAAVAIGKKSLLWAEVFAGGFGGMIARSRPGLDPDPATVRQIIENWWRERGHKTEKPAVDYGSTSDEPMVADDADVSVIAAHAARMGIDLLIPREPSAYPDSVYMIGLSKQGIFNSAFETFPIEVGRPDPQAPQTTPNPDEAAAELRKITQLLTEHKDENSSGAADSQTPTA